jgi:2-polyprenyl-3-methyl-5-hydroxy-6-metoxy-1,4-benzoquinol methylase
MSEDRYYANVNRDLLKMIPRQANAVLELGCGAGALGKAFLEDVNPEATYTGVEMMAGPAEIAEKHLSRVLVGDLEKLSNADLDLQDGSLDVVVYGDVLEHLVDPWQELQRRKNLLKPKGLILACIPNVGHWSILAKLMTDQWLYEDRGILDRTHLRFFTRATVRDLFESAGLKVTRIKGLEQAAQSGTAFAQKLATPLSEMGLDSRYLSNHASVYQWLVKAVYVG